MFQAQALKLHLYRHQQFSGASLGPNEHGKQKTWVFPDRCCEQGWPLKKSVFPKKSQESGDTKCLRDSEKSFIELPDAKQFFVKSQ